MKKYLPRYCATWSDGVQRILHAWTWADAHDLARTLQVPSGVRLVSVKGLP